VSDTRSSTSGGLGLGGALFILFLGLRLTGHIDWAWYWIAAPLWIPLGIALLVVLGLGIAMMISSRKHRRMSKNIDERMSEAIRNRYS
jgi:hypothetical protein